MEAQAAKQTAQANQNPGSWAEVRHATRRIRPRCRPAGAIGFAISTLGAIVTWNEGPAFGPHWYPVALIALAMPTAWLGGELRTMQL